MKHALVFSNALNKNNALYTLLDEFGYRTEISYIPHWGAAYLQTIIFDLVIVDLEIPQGEVQWLVTLIETRQRKTFCPVVFLLPSERDAMLPDLQKVPDSEILLKPFEEGKFREILCKKNRKEGAS